MDRDIEHLNLLSTFHYVLAGLSAFFSLFPGLYIVLGLVMVFAPASFNDHNSNAGPPPELFGWFFVGFGLVFMLVILALATLFFLGGRRLRQRRSHTFCLVVAGISCLQIPFGTALGIFTIIVLQRPRVIEMFKNPQAIT